MKIIYLIHIFFQFYTSVHTQVELQEKPSVYQLVIGNKFFLELKLIRLKLSTHLLKISTDENQILNNCRKCLC